MNAGMLHFSFARRSWIVACVWALTNITLAQPSSSLQATAPQVSQASPAPDFTKARLLMQQGKIDEAISQLQALQTDVPETRGLDLELGTAYYKKSDFPKAIEYLKKASAEDPRNGEAMQLLGLSDYLGGHPADAIPLLEKVQGWYPRANVDAAYILGICYIQAKNYPQARAAFARMFDVAPDSAPAICSRRECLLRQEFDPIAEEYAQKAAALDPKLPWVHISTRRIVFVTNLGVPEAIAEFQKELGINPGHAATY